MARLNDEQYAQILMDRLRRDILEARAMKLRASVVSNMADEVELAAGQLRIPDDSRRSMRELSREARTELRAAKAALREPAPVERVPATPATAMA
jgi:predicted metal-dependent hydrolase